MILRPLAILLLGLGIWWLQVSHVKKHWFLFAIALAMLALLVIQLIPMPPSLWGQLPGRDLVTEIDRGVGLGQVWRPLSLTPDATRNAFFAALVPLAVLVLGVQLKTDELFRLLPVILILGGISAVLGLMQTLADPDSPLYFYSITNNGAAVGLFANRNHQAVLLAMLLPMLAVLASGQWRSTNAGWALRLVALSAALCLLPLLLVTGSRLGFVCGTIALLSLPALLAGSAEKSALATVNEDGFRHRALRTWPRAAPVALGIALIVLTIWLGRGLAWDRLLATDSNGDSRTEILPALFAMIAGYFPVGSGMGSFDKVFQVHEPDALLSPTYMNHAHNDWLEMLLTGGIAAALLMSIALAAFFIQARRAFFSRGPVMRERYFTRLGLVLVLLAAVASISDYPLRVPSLASLFVVAALWASCSFQFTRSWSSSA
jgi:O-antigen ligase